MDRESFLEAVRKQFVDDIHEVYLECEKHEGIDLPRLNRMLKKLMSGARAQGIAERDFIDLVRTTIPDHWNDLDFASLKAA
jgi:hypothetical protein